MDFLFYRWRWVGGSLSLEEWPAFLFPLVLAGPRGQAPQGRCSFEGPAKSRNSAGRGGRNGAERNFMPWGSHRKPAERISPRRVDEVRGVSKHSADAPPRPGGRDTRLINTRATAEQKSRDRLKKTNDCAFVLLIIVFPNLKFGNNVPYFAVAAALRR